MNIRTTRQFIASFRNLPLYDRKAVLATIELFKENPFDPSLRNHLLVRSLAGKRSISVDHDLRIIFTEKCNYADVVLLDIGTHAEVYRA